MKAIIGFLGIALMMLAAVSVPCSIIYGLYEWAVVDVELKVALWEAAKIWLSMIGAGIVGFLMFAIAQA